MNERRAADSNHFGRRGLGGLFATSPCTSRSESEPRLETLDITTTAQQKTIRRQASRLYAINDVHYILRA